MAPLSAEQYILLYQQLAPPSFLFAPPKGELIVCTIYNVLKLRPNINIYKTRFLLKRDSQQICDKMT